MSAYSLFANQQRNQHTCHSYINAYLNTLHLIFFHKSDTQMFLLVRELRVPVYRALVNEQRNQRTCPIYTNIFYPIFFYSMSTQMFPRTKNETFS